MAFTDKEKQMKHILSGMFLMVMSHAALAQSPDVVTTREVFQDWQLTCVNRDDQERCNMNQTQRNQNGQVVAVVNVKHIADGTTLEIGLPLMLDLQQPITVSVDEIFLTDWPYSTCNNQACFVIRKNDQAMLDAFTIGVSANFSFAMYEGREVSLSVSLSGFAAAFSALEAKAP